jgi:hypothetical protein
VGGIVTLTLAGGQLLVMLGLLAALCVLCGAIGATAWYQRGYDLGLSDAVPAARPCPACEAAELGPAADTITFGPIPMDLLEQALDIAQREQATICSADPVLQGRYLELEIGRMIEQADQVIGRLQ